MRFHRNQYQTSVVALAFFSLLLSACSSGVRQKIRRHTYPPEFNYITDQQLKSTMWRFAAKVQQLDDVMREMQPSREGPKREVDRILSEMEQISMNLGPEGWPGNHPKVSRRIERFRDDLAAARRALALNPPNYYLAGSIAGACSHCHTAK